MKDKDNLLEFIRMELLNSKGYLENKIKKLPIKTRKPIYNRIKKLNDCIEIIGMFKAINNYKVKGGK